MRARHDLYGPIHKALRAQGAALLVRLGKADPFDASLRLALAAAIRLHLERVSMHLWHEEEFVHPLLGARDEGLEVLMAEEHREHTRLAADVRDALDGLEHAEGDEAPAAARKLYLDLSLLLAHEFTHMQREETLVQPRLQQQHDDATLRDIEARILASMSPRETRELLSLVLPALNPAEQRTLLLGVPAGARP